MAWIEFHDTVADHPKTIELAARLQIPNAHAVGLLGCLWTWAIRFRDQGNLDGLSVSQIARAARWNGDENTFVKTLVNLNLIDDDGEGKLELHDWWDYAGKLAQRREVNRVRMKRARATHVQRTSRARAPTTVPNPTVPYPTSSLPSEEKISMTNKNSSSHPTADAAGRAVTEGLVNLWNVGKASREWIKVTPQRAAKVKARLKDFTEEQLRKAVANCLDSQWHMGGNDRGWRAPGPEWVLHSVERVEQWLAKQKPKTDQEQAMEILKRKEAENAAQSG